MKTTMRAWVIDQFGGPEAIHPITLPMPLPGPKQVRIRVAATSINPFDLKIRNGQLPLPMDFPAVLHGDVAGVIDAVGDEISTFKLGDEVFGWAGGFGHYQGALADYMLADPRTLIHKPRALPFAEAAALPAVFVVTWEALYDRAAIQPGERLLIQGGAGGVGHLAIQVGKWLGAEVHVTVSSKEKAARVRELGADEVILYPEETVENYVARLTEGKGYDVVLDTVGGEVLASCLRAVRVSGRVVTTNSRSMQDLSLLYMRNITLHGVMMGTPLLHHQEYDVFRAALSRVKPMAEAGALKVLLDDTFFSFDQASQAHARFSSGEARGKVVLLHSDMHDESMT